MANAQDQQHQWLLVVAAAAAALFQYWLLLLLHCCRPLAPALQCAAPPLALLALLGVQPALPMSR
jgi:hypothetical protein